MSIRVGIAGYGVVGKRRQTYINDHPDMHVVAVCDRLFDKQGFLEDGTKFFQNHHDLLEEGLDALFVCLPNYMSPSVTIDGLKSGLHVFCEKPPGRNVQDIVNVRQQESRTRKVLKYGFNHRYHESVKKAVEIVNSKDLGEVLNIRGVYGKSKIIPSVGYGEDIDILSGWRAEHKYAGGGILLDQGIHMLDMMRLFCNDFVEVKSFISNDYWKHNVEDNAFVIMKDANQRVAMLHSSATQWQHKFSLHIALEEGYLSLRGILSGSKSYGQETIEIGTKSDALVGTMSSQKTQYLVDNSWKEEIAEFADAILKGSVIKNGTSRDALVVMDLVERIYKADDSWRVPEE